MKNITLTLIISVFFSHQLFADDQFYGSDADVTFANHLWAVLKNDRLVGENRINVQPFQGNAPHGATQQVLNTTILLNEKNTQVIIKANHMGDKITNKDVYTDQNKYLKAYTVMLKREPGYDSANKNWFWVKYNPNGKILKNPKNEFIAGKFMKGAKKGCIACHQAGGGSDLQFLTKH